MTAQMQQFDEPAPALGSPQRGLRAPDGPSVDAAGLVRFRGPKPAGWPKSPTGGGLMAVQRPDALVERYRAAALIEPGS